MLGDRAFILLRTRLLKEGLFLVAFFVFLYKAITGTTYD